MKLKIFLSLFSSIVTPTNCMESVSQSIQEKLMFPAIIIGMGAANEAAKTLLQNKINEQYNIVDRYNIFLNSLKGGLKSSVMLAALYGASWDKSMILPIECLRNLSTLTLSTLKYKKFVHGIVLEAFERNNNRNNPNLNFKTYYDNYCLELMTLKIKKTQFILNCMDDVFPFACFPMLFLLKKYFAHN